MVQCFFGDPSKPDKYTGTGVDCEYTCRNTLLASEYKEGTVQAEGSCQFSSAVWCRFALAGKPKTNPHKDAEKEIKKLTTEKLGKTIKTDWMGSKGNVENVVGGMMDILDAAGIKKKHTKSLGMAERDDMIDKIISCKQPCLIWMKSHMVAAYAVSSEEIYFYDNNIGLAHCKGKKEAKHFAWWCCFKNGETKWENGDKVKWKGVQCLN